MNAKRIVLAGYAILSLDARALPRPVHGDITGRSASTPWASAVRTDPRKYRPDHRYRRWNIHRPGDNHQHHEPCIR